MKRTEAILYNEKPLIPKWFTNIIYFLIIIGFSGITFFVWKLVITWNWSL